MQLRLLERFVPSSPPGARVNRRGDWTSSVFWAGLLLGAALVGGCADAQGPLDPADFYKAPENTTVQEPIAFTPDNYDFSGEMTIAQARELIRTGAGSQRNWYGFSPQDAFPAGDERQFNENCNPFQNPSFPEKVREVSELPAFIEGVVTLHPRYFQKLQICGEDQRFYGSYFLQDETGGIMILKDSRIANFTFGERVRLRVRGLTKVFDSYAVLTWDSEEVVEPGKTYPIYYEVAEQALASADIGKVRRVRGTIVSEPSSTNFNEMHIEADNGVRYVASVDRELAQRNPGLTQGMQVELTGPVIFSYSQYVVLISSLGQIHWLD